MLRTYFTKYYVEQVADALSTKSGVEERSTSHITSVTTFVKDSSAGHMSDRPAEEGEEEEEEKTQPQSLDIVLPAGKINMKNGYLIVIIQGVPKVTFQRFELIARPIII